MPNGTQRNASYFLVYAGLFLTQAAAAAGLNDSGQTLCYDGSALVACTAANTGDAAPYPRQDARYGRDAAATAGALTKIGGGAAGFDFTALDAVGQPTTPSAGATPHPCVRDNVTHLTWEVKVNDNSQLRHQGHFYTWYSTDGSTNGGDVGSVGSNTSCNSTLTHCNTGGLYHRRQRHRLVQLHRLVPAQRPGTPDPGAFGTWSPAIDLTYFLNTPGSLFWLTKKSNEEKNAFIRNDDLRFLSQTHNILRSVL